MVVWRLLACKHLTDAAEVWMFSAGALCATSDFTMIKGWMAAASRGFIEFVGHNGQSVFGHNVIQLIEFCRHTS